MQIEHLKTYDANKANKKLRGRVAEGKSLTDIQALEAEFNQGNLFPKAFREFLFIGGNYTAISLGFVNGNFKGERDYFDREIRKRGIEIKRPYMVFTSNDDGTIWSFIYLDEGDDPQPWSGSIKESYDNEIWNDDPDPDKWEIIKTEAIWEMPFKSFSELIDKAVYLALNKLTW